MSKDKENTINPQPGPEPEGNAQPATEPGENQEQTLANGDTPSAAEAATPGDGEARQPAAGSEALKLKEAEVAIRQSKEEAALHYEKFLRVSAEFDNYKKRIQKEHADSLRYAITPLIREIAGIVDSLELAVGHARNGQENDGQALVDGIEMIIKQLEEVFSRFGVSRIEAAGKPFDPTLHEAMTVVETEEVPENQVIEEFQCGYLLHDRVVRPSRVSVAKRPAGNGGEGPSEPES